MTISITWLGHGTLSLDANGTNILVDPFLAPNNPTASKTVSDVNPDYILVTHGHMDHTADLIAVAKRSGATVIANVEIADWAQAQGANTHAMNTGGGYMFPFGHVKVTRAFHSSILPDGSYGGNPNGFLLTIDGKRIYIAGDTALFSDMAFYSKDLDVAILPIGDNFTMGVEDSVTAVSDYLKPKSVMPIHYNTWPPITIDLDHWVNAINTQTEATPIVLTIDEPYIL